MNFSIIVEPNAEALVTAAAERFVAVAQSSVADRGRFIFALAGGSTPRALYETLAASPWRERVPWEKVHVFFGDERAVAPGDEYSNGRMARQALLDKIEIPAQNLHFMRGDAGDLDAAARDYEAELRALGAPLDLALLGMGEDGHTASLFPQTPALQENERWCVATAVAHWSRTCHA
jgi:6-phosphogluconolactonase